MKRATSIRKKLHEEALAEIGRTFAERARPVRILKKSESWHQRAIGHLLRVITLGGQASYATRFVTTLGHTVYVPDDFERWEPAHAAEVLRHELVHVKQFERWGWPLMILVYGLLPLPIGLAYGRARLEWEAYEETLRAVAELEGIEAARDPALHAAIRQRFTGAAYAWMWPFPKQVQRWIDEALARIAAAPPRA